MKLADCFICSKDRFVDTNAMKEEDDEENYDENVSDSVSEQDKDIPDERDF